MTPTTRLARPAAARSRGAGLWTRLLAPVMRRRLEDLRGGRISVRDGRGEWSVGEASGRDPLSATLEVRDDRFYRSVALGGGLGASEAYLRGWWEAEDLPRLLRILARNRDVLHGLDAGSARAPGPLRRLLHGLRRNSRRGSRRNIEAHYDLGNDLFALFLDDTLTYSCGVFEHPGASMQEASMAKLDLVCRKLDLRPEHHVLEIGTGWGSFALHAADRHGCRVTTTTISPAQHDLAVRRVRAAGLEDRVRVLRRDYRDLEGTYDRLVSIEMIEAVGHEHLDVYLATCAARLAPGGAALIQAIVMPDEGYDRYLRNVDFIQRHVFPGSCLPSLATMRSAADRTDLRIVDLDDLTPHYVPTLRSWRERFLAHVDEVRRLGYPERFVRLWDFYLAYCEAGFAERYIGDVQVLLAKPGWTAPEAGLPHGAPPAGVAA
jgi:cyclopropane-fatty-acyl-phospholipid synthase